MQLADLLRESLAVDCAEVWENERTPTPVRVFGVRLHSMGLSVREVVSVLKLLGTLFGSILLISERSIDRSLECFVTWFSVEFSAELKGSQIGC